MMLLIGASPPECFPLCFPRISLLQPPPIFRLFIFRRSLQTEKIHGRKAAAQRDRTGALIQAIGYRVPTPLNKSQFDLPSLKRHSTLFHNCVWWFDGENIQDKKYPKLPVVTARDDGNEADATAPLQHRSPAARV